MNEADNKAGSMVAMLKRTYGDGSMSDKLERSLSSSPEAEVWLQINTQEDWECFVREERLAEINTEVWMSQVAELALRGRIEINLKSLNPKDKTRAKTLLRQLDVKINELENGNPYGFGATFVVLNAVVIVLGLIAILAGIVTAFTE